MMTMMRCVTTSFCLLLVATTFNLFITTTSSLFDDQNDYDFIIVGAGSAGSVVASRLSENPSVNVLLLLAGTNLDSYPYILSKIPAAAQKLQGTSFDWHYLSVPQSQACQNFTNHQCQFTSGKALGGTSQVNYMLYIRGNRDDFDRWAALGNPGWGYDDVLPYFMKSEDMTIRDLTKSKYHSIGGPLTVSENKYRSQYVAPFLKTVQEMGYNVRDVNGESQMGFMTMQGTVKKGHRMDTARAFLWPFISRRNLHIKQSAYVQKILFDDKKVAYDVQYVVNGQKHTANCSKEVILSAGGIRSAHLLMLSGVGPEDQLQEFNIDPVAILPGVGNNLMDHVGAQFQVMRNQATSDPFGLQQLFILVSVCSAFIQWLLLGTGMLTTLNGIEVTGFIKTSPQLTDSPNWPESQIGIGILPFNALPKDAFFIIALILQPKSRGTLRLTSTDPTVIPAIDPNYFSHPDDMKALVSGLKQMVEVVKSDAFRQMGYTDINKQAGPPCDVNITDYSSDENMECLARRFTFLTYHFSGTCRMGPDSDPDAVVDAELRVRKVQSLRVVDNSIMPHITTGNPNAPAIMIGEKASDMIKAAYGL